MSREPSAEDLILGFAQNLRIKITDMSTEPSAEDLILSFAQHLRIKLKLLI